MSDYLPQEVILDILHWLPIKDLVKCTAVCKSWNSFIKNPTFISTHLERTVSSNNSTDTHLLLFRTCTRPKPEHCVEHYSLRFDNKDVDKYKLLDFPFSNRCYNSCFRVAGSCNGLVCLAYGHTFILWNPIIQKAVVVPRPNIKYMSHFGFEAFLGFGFDSKTNDYKLLRFVELQGDFDNKIGETSVEVEMYSLNANCWKSITDIAPKYGVCVPGERLYGHSFVNGAIHLLARKVRSLVLAFDVHEEVFNEIQLPECLSNDWLGITELVKYRQSSIAVMKLDNHNHLLQLWVMKEYGIAMSWTKVLNNISEQVPRVLLFRKNGEALVAMHCGQIASHDLKSQHFEFFGVQSPAGYSFVDSFVESLVLLDKGKHASGDLCDWTAWNGLMKLIFTS